MKLLASFLLTLVSLLPASAQGVAPAPPNPPPANAGTNWAATWAAANATATKNAGYVMLWVTLEPTTAGEDAPHTSRLMTNFFNLMPVANKLNKNWGCFKGTLDECVKAGCGKELKAAGVVDAPAFIAVDPTTGDVVDQLLGPVNYLEVMTWTTTVDTGWSLAACQKKILIPANAANPQVNLRYAQALLRAGQPVKASAHFNLALKSQVQAEQDEAAVGQVWCEFQQKNWEFAAAWAKTALPGNASPELQADCLFIQAMSWYELKDYDKSSAAANLLRRNFIRTRSGWKMEDLSQDMGWDFLNKEKIK